jgi:hypothetical protein
VQGGVAECILDVQSSPLRQQFHGTGPGCCLVEFSLPLYYRIRHICGPDIAHYGQKNGKPGKDFGNFHVQIHFWKSISDISKSIFELFV